jgi:RHS repeat-associated protein
VETFAFDPAGNLLDDKATEIRRPLDLTPPRSKLVDNLLREYAGTHYDYDERGNQIQRWHNGQRSDLRWDLFDRLVHFEDPRLSVDFAYDALGRRLHKNSRAHYKQRPEAGSLWNRNEHARKQRELGCGFTLYGWDGDNLAWESSPAQSDGEPGRTVHYVFEPGTFVPVAQAVRHAPIDLIGLPDYSGDYSLDDDPVWNHKATALPFDALAWYQCDHLGTPQELTDSQGNMAWTAQYKAWGQVTEQRSEWARQHGVMNPIRFQGQYHDHETGLHYNRYRYYDSEVGRFISQDPIGLAGGLNLYHYVPNPLEWIDPLGLSASSDLPRMKGTSIPRAGRTLNSAGFSKTKDNGVNETWKHADGSEVRVHKYGNLNACPHKSGNNAHIHKQDPSNHQLDDEGKVSTDPNKTHIGIRNPADLPAVRGRPHGS